MDGLLSDSDRLIAMAASALTGHKRRRFVAEVTLALCEGNCAAIGRTLWLVARDGGKGPARTGQRHSLPGELRGAAATDVGRKESPTGCRHQSHRGAQDAGRPRIKVHAALHQLVGPGSAAGVAGERLWRTRPSRGTNAARPPQPHELSAQADSERQTAQEAQGHRRHLRECGGGQGGGSRGSGDLGNLDGHESESGVRRLFAWGKNQDHCGRESDEGMGP